MKGSLRTRAQALWRLVHDYEALLARQKSHALDAEDSRHLDALRQQVLEEGGRLESPTGRMRRKSPRVRLALQISFQSSEGLAHAWSRDVGSGGLSLSTATPLPVGARIQLQIDSPDATAPIQAIGEVAWASGEAMGIALVELAPLDARRLKVVVSENTSFLERLRGGTGGHVSRADVVLKLPVLVALADAALAEGLLTRLRGTSLLGVTQASESLRPGVIVAALGVRFRRCRLQRVRPVPGVSAVRRVGQGARREGGGVPASSAIPVAALAEDGRWLAASADAQLLALPETAGRADPDARRLRKGTVRRAMTPAERYVQPDAEVDKR